MVWEPSSVVAVGMETGTACEAMLLGMLPRWSRLFLCRVIARSHYQIMYVLA